MFAGKQGFITLRDLFRWAERYRLAEQTEKEYDWLQHLANDGMLLIGCSQTVELCQISNLLININLSQIVLNIYILIGVPEIVILSLVPSAFENGSFLQAFVLVCLGFSLLWLHVRVR